MDKKAYPSLVEIFGDTPLEKLDQPCQDEHLCEIASQITDWPAMVPFFGITAPEMEEIRGKWPFSVGGQRIEFMGRWKEKYGRKGTYRKLCDAFWKAGEVAVAEKVCGILCSQQSSSESSSDDCVKALRKAAAAPIDPMHESMQEKSSSHHHTNPPLPHIQNRIGKSRTASLESLADYLRMTYGSVTPSFIALQWPPPPTLKVFNLALIHEETIRRKPLDENLIMLTMTGNIDEIMKMKSSIQLSDLFRGQGKKRKVVLVEGPPGSGKSTMAYDICQKWETRKMFYDEFKVVIYIQFRDLEVHSAQKIADLLPFMLQSEQKEAASLIEACSGEGALFVLDGWDEYSCELQEGSLFEKLICRPEKLSLQRSTVVVTSRPVASGCLQKYATSRVEIVGFTPEEVHQYFEDVFSDTLTVQKLHEHLQERPLIKASCYLPLNAAIVAHLFMELNCTLPTTLHGLFSSLVLSCIIRHLTKELGTEPDIMSLRDLPPEVQGLFQKVCIVAYEGAMHNKVIFSSQDLQSYGLPKDLNALSLMQVVQSLATGKPKSYHFLHISIEELLAAQHISSLSPLEQVQIFTELFGQPRFDAVFRYFAAFAKLQTEGIRDIVSRIVDSASLGKEEDKARLLYLMHCLYEAQDVSLCRFVSTELGGGLDLNESWLTPFDLLSLKYFLLCVNDSNAGPAQSSDTNSCDVTLSELSLSYCGLTTEYIDSLSLHHLVTLDVSGNRLSCPCAANILNNTQLKTINLSDCVLMDDGVELFAAALRDHCSLESLSLSSKRGSKHSMHHVLQAILFHRSLRYLNIRCCRVDMKDVAAVLEVNKSLRVLSLGGPVNVRGTVITASDSVILARSLGKNKTLETLTLVVAIKNSPDWTQDFVWNLRDCYLKTLEMLLFDFKTQTNVLYQQRDRVNEVRRHEKLPLLELHF